MKSPAIVGNVNIDINIYVNVPDTIKNVDLELCEKFRYE